MTPVSENLHHIQSLIKEYAQRYQRQAEDITLLAVTKRQPVDKMKEAILAGQLRFGESYLQEALPKITELASFTQNRIEWHFIGPIQSNKTKLIAEHFDWVHSVASMKVAKRLSDQRPTTLPPLNICVEVNISGESTKSGAATKDVFELVNYCRTLSGIRVRGLMAIPEPETDLAKQRHSFNNLASLQQELITHVAPLDTLSMGMSEDFEAAIAEGSTIVRIGSAIFGER